MHQTNPNIFCNKFTEKLSCCINIDVAKVKKIPKNIIPAFERVFRENSYLADEINFNGNKYGILKLKKHRVVLFYVKTTREYQCYIASEISEKRILNYIQFIKQR